MNLLAEAASVTDLAVPIVSVVAIVGVFVGAYGWLNRQFSDLGKRFTEQFTELKDRISAAATKAEGSVQKTHLKLFLARLQIENPTLKIPSIDEILDD